MAKCGKETFKTSRQATSTDLRNVTFSQALAAGHTHCDWLAGPTTGKSGRDRVLASHSVRPENAKALMTRGICGPLFAGSSPSADLQQSLENRLRARTDVNGSPEYVLTWKHWDMESGPPICALRASVRRTCGNGYGGWPTPNAGPQNDGDTTWMERRKALKAKHGNGNGFGLTLGQASQLAGWQTPTQGDVQRGGYTYDRHDKSRPRHSNVRLLAGWPSPTALSFKESHQPGNNRSMNRTKELAGWPTPNVMAGGSKSRGGDRKDELLIGGLVHGLTSTSSPAPTAANGVLNSAFSRWLMGYPATWDAHAPYWKQWATVQWRLDESFENREAFWHWLVEIGLAASKATAMPSSHRLRPSS